ncbi:MAG: hypothetical protein KAS32_10275, partial [Candidatus Peribacteraceae bacterium]|nr:hypothetical protein [Candidatus Peribacteraceae bacterium]
MKFLIDMSSVLWACLLAGKDEENGEEVEFEGKTKLINSAFHGYETFMLMMRGLFNEYPTSAPYKCIMVEDGYGSRGFRRKMYKEYKGKRKPKAPEQTEQFNLLVKMAKETMLGLGAQSVVQHGMEADDVLAYLSEKLEGDMMILSKDGDMLALINDRVSVRTPDGEVNPDKYSPCPFEYTHVYKALVGDTSDNIKGAVGFGPKAFIELYIKYEEEGLKDLAGMMHHGGLETLAEQVEDFPLLQKIIDSAESVTMSYAMARFHLDAIDTLHSPLQWEVGMVKCWEEGVSEPILEEFYQEIHLVHAGNYSEMVSEAAPLIAHSEFVGFDLETSTPEASDAWVKLNTSKSGSPPVDVFGSEITGAGFTFGRNLQYTFYFTVDHVETDDVKNIRVEQLRQFLLTVPQTVPIVVHNCSFELPVCYNAWGDKQEDNDYHGFLPNVHDTMHLSAYVDENQKHGLKPNSKRLLNYDQQTYAEVTGGKKMNQLTAEHVLSYGADDPICTCALYNHFRTVCQHEGSWNVYLDLEPSVAYLLALAFIRGIDIDQEYLEELRAEDQKSYEDAWEIAKAYLLKIGWDGAEYHSFVPTAAGIKYAFKLITGNEFKQNNKRKLEKLYDEVEDQGAKEFADWLRTEDWPAVNSYVKEHFKAEPTFNIDSPKQYCELLFDVMKLPVHLRNKPTDTVREKARETGKTAQGSPKTDALAIVYALEYDVKKDSEERRVLKALSKMKECNTRRKFYYVPYAKLPHWIDGKVHAQYGQNMTNTRRFAPNRPNLAQLPKKGDNVRVRGIIAPHRKDASILALDEKAQEMRMIGDYSKDSSLCSCFVGDNKKDVHALTGLSIAQKKGHPELTYEDFYARYEAEEVKKEKGI